MLKCCVRPVCRKMILRTVHTLEERIIIYADRLVDIIIEDIVTITQEIEAEERFEEILRAHKKYGKNDNTLARYLDYHREIQNLLLN